MNRPGASFTLAVYRPAGLSVDTFAVRSGLHPDLVERLVKLGLLDGTLDAAGRLRLPASQLAVAARLERLRSGFALNYAALGLVMDLLDRIAVLEREQSTRTIRPRPEGSQ